MNCPTDNALRSYVDHELAPLEAAELEAHLASCPACRVRAEALSSAALRVGAHLASLDGPASVAEANPQIALARFRTNLASIESRPSFFARVFAARWRFAWAASLGALLLALSLLFPAARSFAQRLLATLRVEKVQTVSLDFSSLDTAGTRHLHDALQQMFSEKVVVTTNEKETDEPSRAAASQLAGFPVRLLPTRVDTPRFRVSGAHAFHMTVDRSRLQDLVDQAGRTDLILPPSLDGATVSVQVPRAVEVSYGNCVVDRHPTEPPASPSSPSSTDPCVSIIQAPSPTVDVPSDLNLQQIAEIGLQLGGMDAVQAREFCQSVDWKSTLVLPIPPFVQSYETVYINGVRGTLLHFPRRERASYALIWVDGGTIYSLVGQGDSNSAVQLASSLE
jgi:anti-sigma factor RsiW